MITMISKDVFKDLKKDLGSNILCIAEYGLAGKNHVVVVDELGYGILKVVEDSVKKLAKKDVYPLFVTTEELADGRDVFPLEFLNIMSTKRIIHGKDAFENMKFDKEHVRRELESEFRSKLLTLRQGYLEACGLKKELGALVGRAIPTLAPVCYGMLYLQDLEPPKTVDALLSSISRAYDINVDVLSLLNQKHSGKMPLPELNMAVKDLMRFLAELGEVFDEMKQGVDF